MEIKPNLELAKPKERLVHATFRIEPKYIALVKLLAKKYKRQESEIWRAIVRTALKK